MKKCVFILLLLLIKISIAKDIDVVNNYKSAFQDAYNLYPEIPKGLLEAVSFNQTKFTHIINNPNDPGSCIGMPKCYGVMGLTLDGKNYFRSNLNYVSELSGISVEDIIGSPNKNILGYAKAFVALKNKLEITGNSPADFMPILIGLSELPLTGLQNDFALNSQLYSIYIFLNNGYYQQLYGFPNYAIDLSTLFGAENYAVLSATKVIIQENCITTPTGKKYIPTEPQILSADYAPAIWDPAAACNYSVNRGAAISAVTIHDIEGSYAGCISWFKNCAASVSAHYILRSSDGQITQMVLEAYRAYHVGSENPYTIGLEHEGYYNQQGWYTMAMYTASADLVRDITQSGYGISPLRTYYGPSCNGSCVLGACTKIKGHQHYPNQSHNDPGLNWDWYTYYNLINNNPTITINNAATGNFYDSGNINNNYSDDEAYQLLISPTNAQTVALTFSAFDIESGYDNMFIYDGNDRSAPLIGMYTGQASPGTITSTGNSLLIEFRSDCGTTAPGWAASWTSVLADNITPTSNISAPAGWITQNFNATFVDTDNVGGSGIDKSFYHIINYNGADWRCNNQNGFFRDNFDLATIHPDWTTMTGVFAINGGYLEQSDENNSNTNIYAALDQSLSDRYLYTWQGKIDGVGINRRAGFHFFCDDATQTNRGNSYFVWFRVDQSQLQIYKVVNNVFGSPVLQIPVTITAGQWYDYAVSYDRILGKMDVYANNSKIASYTDGSPYSNGAYISLRSADCNYMVNDLKAYRSRTNSVNISVGAAAVNDIRYQSMQPNFQVAAKIKSITNDVVGNLSPVASADLMIDWTAPLLVAQVNDGINSDTDTTFTGTQLSANWTSSVDSNSAISSYKYAIGTTANDSDVVAWTNNGLLTSVTKTNLTLVDNQLYYVSVKSIDGGGLICAASNSDGIRYVDITGIEENKNILQVSLFPNPIKDNVTLSFYAKNASTIQIKMTDVIGRTINIAKNIACKNGLNTIPVNLKALSVSSGVYTLSIQSSEGEFTIPCVVEK